VWGWPLGGPAGPEELDGNLAIGRRLEAQLAVGADQPVALEPQDGQPELDEVRRRRRP
jgi:hypothetical protein